MNTLRHELPIAMRRLARAPGFALTVTGFLGVSIASLLAVAAVVYGLWLRPLPFPASERLVEVRGWSRAMSFSLGLSAPLIAELPQVYPAIEAHGPWEGRREEGGIDPAALSAGAFAALGAQPLLGRLLDDSDGGGAADAVLISESLWRARYGAGADVIGRTLEYGGRTRRIVGVLPEAFRFPDGRTNAWLPLVLTPADTAPDQAQVFGGLKVVARLAPGASIAAFDAALQSRYARDERIAGIREHMKLAFEAKPLREALGGAKAGVVGLLAAAVAMVLLTALANLANLWLTRALARQRELALAAALGASAGRAAASVFAEVLVLTVAASALGLALAPGVLAALGAGGVLERDAALVFAIDAPMAALAAMLALALSLVLALPAWWLVRRIGGLDALRQGPGVLADRPSLARARRALIAVQIAAAFALVGAGGLLARSMSALVNEDLGFSRDGTLLATIEPPVAFERDYVAQPPPAEAEAVRGFYARMRSHENLEVSFANAPPFGGSESVATFLPPGAATGEEAAAKVRNVGRDYFRVIGIPFVVGGVPAAGDPDAIVVDEVFARRYLAAGDPLVQQIGFDDGDEPATSARIAGVVRTVKHAALDERDEQGTYYSFRDAPSGAYIQLVLRTLLPLADARAIVEREAAAAGLRVTRVASIDALIWQTLRERAALIGMIGAFALLGTALAALGLYAVLAFATRRRTAEYGLKLALGADGGRVAREVVRDAIAIALPGLALGALVAAFAVRALGSRLHGVGGADPLTWGVVLVAILAIVLLAAAVPARRAAHIAPMSALRNE